MGFKVTKIDLGPVIPGKEIRIVYPYEDISLITRIISPCVCSNVTNDMKNKEIVAYYTPASFPKHLKGINQLTLTKKIKVEYEVETTGGEDKGRKVELVFTSIINK